MNIKNLSSLFILLTSFLFIFPFYKSEMENSFLLISALCLSLFILSYFILKKIAFKFNESINIYNQSFQSIENKNRDQMNSLSDKYQILFENFNTSIKQFSLSADEKNNSLRNTLENVFDDIKKENLKNLTEIKEQNNEMYSKLIEQNKISFENIENQQNTWYSEIKNNLSQSNSTQENYLNDLKDSISQNLNFLNNNQKQSNNDLNTILKSLANDIKSTQEKNLSAVENIAKNNTELKDFITNSIELLRSMFKSSNLGVLISRLILISKSFFNDSFKSLSFS